MLRWLDTPGSCAGRPWSEWKPSDRKLRLFACAGCRAWPCDTHPMGQSYINEMIACAEEYADGNVGARKRLSELIEQPDEMHISTGLVMLAIGSASNAAAEFSGAESQDRGVEFAALLREVVGNPWHPFRCSWCLGDGQASHEYDREERPCMVCGGNGGLPKRWLTPTVVNLARQAYDDRAFDSLLILADALEDAGCTNAIILEHLRGPGPHVLGCFALDLVLGKS